jgi:hypothetical protein
MKIIYSISLGILAAAGALVMEILFFVLGGKFPDNNFSSTLPSIIFLAAIEESVKLAIIYKKFYLDEAAGNIFKNSFGLAMGFSFLEVFLLFSSLRLILFQKPEVFSISGIFFIHLITTMTAAYFISRRPYNICLKLLIVLTFNVFIHSFYNFFMTGRF